MHQLYKTLTIIGGIIIIQLLKRLFDTIWIVSIPFHHNFLSSIQVFLLLWLMISLILDLTLFRKLSFKKAIQKTTLIVFSLFIFPELIFVFLLHHPAFIPQAALPFFRDYYETISRNIIQLNPECGRYDSSLFYTLIPERKFAFNNMEFRSDYHTNSKGLRDDERSLNKPAIIVLGDSHAMGWGVQQDETFAQQLEKITGKLVLNAAVSSYGTARELKNLYRLDTSGLQYLIIQYCRNDAEENKEFIRYHYELPISSAVIYDKSVQIQFWNNYYFPGKHFTTIGKRYIKTKFGELRKNPRSTRTYLTDTAAIKLEESAQNFIDILYQAPLNFGKLKVLVMDINNSESKDDLFVEKANSIQQLPRYQQKFKSSLLFIPVSKILTKEDYYILDTHLRARGHQKVAALFQPYLSSK